MQKLQEAISIKVLCCYENNLVVVVYSASVDEESKIIEKCSVID